MRTDGKNEGRGRSYSLGEEVIFKKDKNIMSGIIYSIAPEYYDILGENGILYKNIPTINISNRS